MPVLPITSERLHLRVMRPEDADVLAAYRADEAVAKYQDWPMPYSLADAERLLADQADRQDLAPEGWTQVAIVHDGRVVGDVAVELRTGAEEAALGYTLSPEAQGRGFATEAAGAIVDAVFEGRPIRRFVASLDAQNVASMRVAESLGFRYEGTARGAALVRGEWVDDERFALLRNERTAWRTRDFTPPDVVELVELVDENSRQYANLATHRWQEEFVAPMTASFRHALLPEAVDGTRLVPWFRGIAADGQPVGFVMLAVATESFSHPFLWRLLIDRWHQRRGIGGHALRIIIDRLRDEGHERLDTSWGTGPGTPEPFYRRFGFVPTGHFIDHEVEATLALG